MIMNPSGSILPVGLSISSSDWYLEINAFDTLLAIPKTTVRRPELCLLTWSSCHHSCHNVHDCEVCTTKTSSSSADGSSSSNGNGNSNGYGYDNGNGNGNGNGNDNSNSNGYGSSNSTGSREQEAS
jgi:hypothetical protein